MINRENEQPKSPSSEGGIPEQVFSPDDGKTKSEKILKLKEKLHNVKQELHAEKSVKNKLYKGLVKLASELKDARTEAKSLKENLHAEHRSWYEGGMWRAPELLPQVAERNKEPDTVSPKRGKDAVSLSDLFFDLVIVTAFNRVGVAIQDGGGVNSENLAYFIIFWLIWGKEASVSTRFNTTDLSSQLETLLTCFAVLFGSLSSTSHFNSGDGTRMMIVAMGVAVLHFLLHLRVYFWFKDVSPLSDLVSVKNYAIYIMTLTSIESFIWFTGIAILDENSKYRNYIFWLAILLSFRLPRTFLPNDFHAACSKRAVLFILLLGFILQSVFIVASPFFDYQMPSSEQYCFLGLICFLLFCIKLLYVEDSCCIDPSDHALLVSRVAGLFFHLGQLFLLLSTTILGAGLNLLTHSYLAATAALPDNARVLVCGGFSGVVLSIGFIKSMHIRRVPLNPEHRQLFYAAYGTQIVVLLGVATTTISMSIHKFLGQVALSEFEMLGVLCSLALFLLVISWLDEAVELNIYGEADAREFRVHPFGLWTCIKPGLPDPPLTKDPNKMFHLGPMVKESSANLFDSQVNLSLYGSLRNLSNEDDNHGERKRLVKFIDDENSDLNV